MKCFSQILDLIENLKARDVAQLGSAPVLGTGGHRFKSCHLENKALLVQLVERRFPKPDVVGSIPTGRVFINLNE